MKLASAEAAGSRESLLVFGRLTVPRSGLLIVGPIVLIALLFKLAISEGGRHFASLTFVQTGVFLLAAAVVAAGYVRRTSLTWPIVAVLLITAASALWSIRPESSVRVLLQWGMYASIYSVASTTLTSRAAARRFVDAAVAIGGWLSLIALYLFWGSGDLAPRWYSTFYWPNPFATFLLLVLPLELTRCLHAPRAREALSHGAMTVLLAVPFVLTYSRGGWLVLVALLPLLLLLLRSSRVLAVRRLSAVILATAVSVLLLSSWAGGSRPEGIAGRAASLVDAGDYSLQGRIQFLRGAVEMIRDRPLAGLGAGTFGYAFARYQSDVRFYARDAHNLYLQTAAEQGIPGAVALAVLVVSAAALWLRTLRKAGPDKDYPLLLGIGLGVMAFFMHSGIEMSWSYPANPALAFALLGVIAWYDRTLPASGSTAAPHRGLWTGLVAALLVIAVVPAQLTLAAQREFVAGKGLYGDGKWTDAAERFRRAARLNPIDPVQPSALADALQRSMPGGSEENVGLVRRAMALDRMNAYYPVQLARLLFPTALAQAPARADAIALLERAIVLDPFHYPEAYQLLARLHAVAGNARNAEDVYAAARQRYPRGLTKDPILRGRLWPGVVVLFMDWAALRRVEGRAEDALAVYLDIMAEDPTYVPAYLETADLYLRERRPREASDILARGLQNVPASEILWVWWKTVSVNRRARWEF